MILRGASMSEKRTVLGPARAERPLTPVAQPKPSEPTAEPLSIDAVLKWLEKSDALTRSTIARALDKEFEQLRKSAFEEAQTRGHAQGWEAGDQEAQSALRGKLNTLTILAEEAAVAFEAESSQLAAQCADIVCEAFVKLAGAQLASREAVLGAVTQVLQRVKESGEVIIRVSAADFEVLESLRPELQQALGETTFSLVADQRVDLGGCIVESRHGGLDGRLDVQLRALFETMRAAKALHEEAR